MSELFNLVGVDIGFGIKENKVTYMLKNMPKLKYICLSFNFFIMKRKKLNRLKLVLVEKEKSNKWLAEKLNKSETTISNWCTNVRQPSLETLNDVAEILEVDISELLIRTNGH